jgi:hypothetical protein
MAVKKFQTVSSIIDDVLASMDPNGFDEAKGYPKEDLPLLHHTMGRQIRNDYGFWSDSPLTKNWRENVCMRDVRNGVDFSEDHPDAVSMFIIRRVWEIARS